MFSKFCQDAFRAWQRQLSMAVVLASWHASVTRIVRLAASAGGHQAVKKSGRGNMRRVTTFGMAALLAWPLAARGAETRGVSATEVKIGQTMPYSGPDTAFCSPGTGEASNCKV